MQVSTVVVDGLASIWPQDICNPRNEFGRLVRLRSAHSVIDRLPKMVITHAVLS